LEIRSVGFDVLLNVGGRLLTSTLEELHISGVRAIPSNNPDRHKSQPDTLGDILYANKSKERVSEAEWTALVRSIAAGNQRALHALYEQTHRLVFTLIVRITNNRETAEELTLDVFHDVWRKASAYDPEGGSVVGWIMNQARCRAIDRLRFEQRKKRVNGYADSPETSPVVADPLQACQLEEQNRILREALEVLTPGERVVIETAFFSELTYQEAAERLNQPLGTVKTRIRAGLTKLRHALKGKLTGI
jgi:RNA polymerase sigma-70 factor (ECF subfamily)